MKLMHEHDRQKEVYYMYLRAIDALGVVYDNRQALKCMSVFTTRLIRYEKKLLEENKHEG